jgi:hypothetical protein
MKHAFNIKVAIITLAIAIGGVSLVPTPVAAQSCGGGAGFTLLPPWYKGLLNGCKLKSPQQAGGIDVFIYKIILNLSEALFYIVGYVSLAMIIWGGFKYMTQGDSSGGIEAAKKTIMNAIIGLVISIFAVLIVNVVSGAFT